VTDNAVIASALYLPMSVFATRFNKRRSTTFATISTQLG